MFDPIAVVEAVATLFWVYAGLAILAWGRQVWSTDASRHVAMVTDFISHLVPAMIALVVVVLAGAFFGFPTVVVVIAILFPAGLAFGAHFAVEEVAPATLRQQLLRLALAGVIGAAVILYRQTGG